MDSCYIHCSYCVTVTYHLPATHHHFRLYLRVVFCLPLGPSGPGTVTYALFVLFSSTPACACSHLPFTIFLLFPPPVPCLPPAPTHCFFCVFASVPTTHSFTYVYTYTPHVLLPVFWFSATHTTATMPHTCSPCRTYLPPACLFTPSHHTHPAHILTFLNYLYYAQFLHIQVDSTAVSTTFPPFPFLHITHHTQFLCSSTTTAFLIWSTMPFDRHICTYHHHPQFQVPGPHTGLRLTFFLSPTLQTFPILVSFLLLPTTHTAFPVLFYNLLPPIPLPIEPATHTAHTYLFLLGSVLSTGHYPMLYRQTTHLLHIPPPPFTHSFRMLFWDGVWFGTTHACVLPIVHLFVPPTFCLPSTRFCLCPACYTTMHGDFCMTIPPVPRTTFPRSLPCTFHLHACSQCTRVPLPCHTTTAILPPH